MIKFWGFTAGLVIFVLLFSPNGYAHGRHHTSMPVRPAYDCFKYKNPETGKIFTTEGDISVTRDDDLGYFIKYLCVCEKIDQSQPVKWVCWWKEIDRKKILKNMVIPSNTRHYRQAYIQNRMVQWMAHPRYGGCHNHRARKSVIYVVRKR